MTKPVETPLTLVAELIDTDGLVPARAVAFAHPYRLRIRSEPPEATGRSCFVTRIHRPAGRCDAPRDADNPTRPASYRIERSDGSVVEGEFSENWMYRVCCHFVASGVREAAPCRP